MPRKPEQFDLFAPPPTSEEEKPPSSPDEEFMPVAEDESYHPTDEEVQEHIKTEYGPGARYIPPKSRAEREAAKRRRKALSDDALGRMGEPGKQLLSDAESPFARGLRDAEERRKKKGDTKT